MSALKAMPSLQLVVKLWMLTLGYLRRKDAELASVSLELASVSLELASPGRLHLTPEQQGVFGRTLLLVVFSLHADVLDLRTTKHRFTHKSKLHQHLHLPDVQPRPAGYNQLACRSCNDH